MTISGGSAGALSIGAVLGDSDSESLAWGRSVGLLGKQVAGVRGGFVSPLRVNVVFHIDGKLAPNEFTGVRTGRFSRRDSRLVVQAAVPAGEVRNRRDVLMTLLGEAIDEAERFARSEGIAEELVSLRALIDLLPPG
jgi:hypothetical protein